MLMCTLGSSCTEKATFLIKVIRPRGEDSWSRNRSANIALISRAAAHHCFLMLPPGKRYTIPRTSFRNLSSLLQWPPWTNRNRHRLMLKSLSPFLLNSACSFNLIKKLVCFWMLLFKCFNIILLFFYLFYLASSLSLITFCDSW